MMVLHNTSFLLQSLVFWPMMVLHNTSFLLQSLVFLPMIVFHNITSLVSASCLPWFTGCFPSGVLHKIVSSIIGFYNDAPQNCPFVSIGSYQWCYLSTLPLWYGVSQVNHWSFTNDATSQNWLHVPIIGKRNNDGASQYFIIIIGVQKPPLCLNYWLLIIRCFVKSPVQSLVSYPWCSLSNATLLY